jgi:hypothetical protein
VLSESESDDEAAGVWSSLPPHVVIPNVPSAPAGAATAADAAGALAELTLGVGGDGPALAGEEAPALAGEAGAADAGAGEALKAPVPAGEVGAAGAGAGAELPPAGELPAPPAPAALLPADSAKARHAAFIHAITAPAALCWPPSQDPFPLVQCLVCFAQFTGAVEHSEISSGCIRYASPAVAHGANCTCNIYASTQQNCACCNPLDRSTAVLYFWLWKNKLITRARPTRVGFCSARAGSNFHNFLVAKITVCYLAKNPLGGTGVGGPYRVRVPESVL